METEPMSFPSTPGIVTPAHSAWAYSTCKMMKALPLMPKGESEPQLTNTTSTVSSFPLLIWCICCFPLAGFGAVWFWSLAFGAVCTCAAKQNEMTKVELLSLESVPPSSYTAAVYKIGWTSTATSDSSALPFPWKWCTVSAFQCNTFLYISRIHTLTCVYSLRISVDHKVFKC